MSYCPDCGSKTSSDVCANCQEELYILREQADYIDRPVSDEFAEKAEAQERFLKRRKETA